MENRNPTLIGVLAGALMIAVLAIGAIGTALISRPSSAQAQAVGVSGMRQITVVGSGEVKVTPDTASVQIGVETTAPTTQEALSQNSAQASAIIEQIKALGVAEKDIQTSGFNIYPTYNDTGREVTGYTVSNQVSVTIRDLAQAGGLLDQVVQAGANRIYGVSFSVADPSAALAQARDKAVADAKARAEQLAGQAGATVGQVLVISENVGSGPVVPMPMMDRAMGASAEAPIQAGEQSYSAQVQITFELR
ncbi:SIMPL domain-containing protein [Oscillochloris sp. ZM17-4]|uniref:SIMPL domain-containing protein n=1 Tax=Oscillochloris sp. ZM17-4 TaxID=2866714 RepID=UPI001C7301FF|nr:SIMPL domain-containing protein [Oscillochloris sp. ZM17-4]MBX0327859.1 SIMPL domain-containing protein [Oscillochloris sp. ZM17-4]